MGVILILSVLGLLTYSNSFNNAFHFDDFPNIVNNLSIRNAHDFLHIFNSEPSRCVTYFSFALNYYWGGLHVGGYHAVNLLIHVAVSVLVWQLVRLTLNAPSIKKELSSFSIPWIAFFAAAIFLTHPLQTQPVNYIYQRAVLLVAFFYVGALILFIKSEQSWQQKGGAVKGVFFYGASLLSAVCCMFSKENAVSLPVMMCFYQWFVFGENKKTGFKRIIPFFLVVLLIPLSWGVLNVHALMGLNKTAQGLSQGLPVGKYAMTQGGVIMTYLKLLVWPLHQRVTYDYAPVTCFWTLPVLGSLLFLLGLIGLAIAFRNKCRLLSFGVCWLFIALMPESSFWPNNDLIFEHRMYLPLLGFAVFLSSGIFYIFQTRGATLAQRILLVIVICFALLSYQRNKIWRDDFSLWDNAVHESPGSVRAYLNRGAAYQARGDLYHAMMDYNMVIGLGPVDAVTLSNRGSIFQRIGQRDLALANYNLAIKINPNYSGTYFNRGLLYKEEGKYALALADFDKAIGFEPQDKNLYQLRAETYFLFKASARN